MGEAFFDEVLRTEGTSWWTADELMGKMPLDLMPATVRRRRHKTPRARAQALGRWLAHQRDRGTPDWIVEDAGGKRPQRWRVLPDLVGVPLPGMDTLTPRQQEVLGLWLEGTPYRELADALGISPETVNPHLKAIARKLGAAGISREALRAAL